MRIYSIAAIALHGKAQATTTCSVAVASVRRQRAPWSGASITTSGLVLRQASAA
jgi:hypothetical protein